MRFQIYFYFLLLIQFDLHSCLFDAALLGYAAFAGAAFYAYKWKCNYFECCEILNSKGVYYKLQNELAKKVFGQPILLRTLPNAIHHHVNKEKPSSPLVLSFHGWTGSGKTYTSTIVAETLFEKGLKSIYVNKITPSTLYPNPSQIEEYKKKFIELLDSQASICKHSLIIIEEIDKLNPELIDILSSYLNNYNPFLNHMIFIFTSNVGSDKIVKKTFDFYNQGKKREDIQLHDLEHVVKNEAYNYENSMKHSSLITSHLISHYIPFLPLERSHIDKCIKKYMSLGGYKIINENIKNIVYKSLEWWPADLKLYSNSGCKQIENKIDIALRIN